MKGRNPLLTLIAITIAGLLTSAGLLVYLSPRGEPAYGPGIILMVGDGMGTGHLAAARMLSPAEFGLNIDRLSHSGFVTTHSYDSLITDSAAAATALATGNKTRNGVIGQDHAGNTLDTVLEIALRRGMSAGLVTNTRITHATPAAFAAHVSSRGLEEEIASQLIDVGPGVLLGGGRSFFLPETLALRGREDQRDLISEAAALGYYYASDKETLKILQDEEMVLGLFAHDHMSFEKDRNRTMEPSLGEMADFALRTLSRNPRGFFVMIEGGRIDHASHNNDLDRAMSETLAFDEAVGVAFNFTARTTNGLLVVTADHETGGLSIVENPNADGVLISWSTRGHTGNDVPLYSHGPNAHCFSGTIGNNEVGNCLFEAVAESQIGPPQESSYISDMGNVFSTEATVSVTYSLEEPTSDVLFK